MSGETRGRKPSRTHLEPPPERVWGVVEHSDRVFYVESAKERIGPFPAEAAHREADRQNEYELVIAVARAMLGSADPDALEKVAAQSRFEGAFDPLLAAALHELYSCGECDESCETAAGPVAIIDRFLLLVEPTGVAVREYDSPEDAIPNFEVLCEEG